MNGDQELVTMKDGRVMTMRGDRLIPLEEETSLPDGTRVLPDGTVVMTDGNTRLMREGETLYMNDRMMDMANKPDEPSSAELEDTETHDPT